MSKPNTQTNVNDQVKEDEGEWKYEKWNEFHNEESKPLSKTKLQKGG